MPRLTPAGAGSSVAVEPAWAHAFLGEAFCLALAVAMRALFIP